MIAVEEARVVPFRKILKTYPELENSTIPKKTLFIPPVKIPVRKEEDIPVDKWIMPPQPERYIKGSDHDLF